MKKILMIALCFASCKGTNTYVNHTDGQYAITEDTLVIQDSTIINYTGYQKIRNGKALPKEWKRSQWPLHGFDAPAIRFDNKHAYLNNTIYTKLP